MVEFFLVRVRRELYFFVFVSEVFLSIFFDY